MIKNNLDKWGELKKAEFSQSFDKNRILINFLEDYTSTSAIFELQNARPFMINSEKTERLIFDYNGDLFANVSVSLISMILLWEDVKGLQREEFVLAEASNFKNFCEANLAKHVRDAAKINAMPLFHRPKINDSFINLKMMREEEEESGKSSSIFKR
jgi:hypothetical protein